MTQKPSSPLGVLTLVFFSERIMSSSQANSDERDLMVALLSTATKSSASATSK